MESLTIDYELPLKTNKSLTPSSLHPRPNSKSKTLLKTQIQFEKARRKQKFKKYIAENKKC